MHQKKKALSSLHSQSTQELPSVSSCACGGLLQVLSSFCLRLVLSIGSFVHCPLLRIIFWHLHLPHLQSWEAAGRVSVEMPGCQ